VSESGLIIDNLRAGYGQVEVVKGLSLTVDPGETVALVGRNGAGKTTALAAAAGLRYGVGRGSVQLGGEELYGQKPDAILRSGLRLVGEGRRVFREMTVWENMRVGAFSRRKSATFNEDIGTVWTLFPILEQFRERLVGSLSGGQQQMVAIGQAIMARPRFMLLDEPTAGLAPSLIDELYDSLVRLTERGVGLLLVDQNIDRVIQGSDRFYVMDNGIVVDQGVSTDEAVRAVTAVVLAS
jgi:branched-chain amino acid transport system ATP-binding protein